MLHFFQIHAIRYPMIKWNDNSPVCNQKSRVKLSFALLMGRLTKGCWSCLKKWSCREVIRNGIAPHVPNWHFLSFLNSFAPNFLLLYCHQHEIWQSSKLLNFLRAKGITSEIIRYSDILPLYQSTQFLHWI